MQYRVFDDMSVCTAEDVDRLQKVVSSGRKSYAMRYKHLFGQWTALKAWEMVYELTGMRQDWSVGQYGKPFVRGGVSFSISHCKRGVAVAIDERGEFYPVGIDIESIRSVDQALIERTMNDKEQEEIAKSPNPSVAFTRLWTQKEALLKYKGTGIIDDLKQVLMDVGDWQMETIVNENKGYIVSICSHE